MGIFGFKQVAAIWTSAEEFKECIEKYYSNETVPTLPGLALYMGFPSKKEFLKMAFDKRIGFYETVQWALTKLEAEYQKGMLTSQKNGKQYESLLYHVFNYDNPSINTEQAQIAARGQEEMPNLDGKGKETLAIEFVDGPGKDKVVGKDIKEDLTIEDEYKDGFINIPKGVCKKDGMSI